MLAYDKLGHGDTYGDKQPDGYTLTVENLADVSHQITTQRRAKGYEEVGLIGHSDGGVRRALHQGGSKFLVNQIAVPTVILVAKEDRIFDARRADDELRLWASAKDISNIRYEGIGHGVEFHRNGDEVAATSGPVPSRPYDEPDDDSHDDDTRQAGEEGIAVSVVVVPAGAESEQHGADQNVRADEHGGAHDDSSRLELMISSD